MKVLTVSPRGFCAGVRRAIDIVELAFQKFQPPIYVRKEIVHNKSVVEDFERRGVIFIDEVDQAPRGSSVIFSAHGIAPEVRQQAKMKDLRTIDATCPLVTKVHLEVHRFLKEGFKLILIGHKDHDEVVGTMGEAPGQIILVENEEQVRELDLRASTRIMILTQTTLSVDETKGILAALFSRFPNAKTPPKEDICYATQNRQDAVRDLLEKGIEVLLVVGSQNSSNSQRLCEVARDGGIRAYLIDHAHEIQADWLHDTNTVGVTAGASAPEIFVYEVVKIFEDRYRGNLEEDFFCEGKFAFFLLKELNIQKVGC